jgi:diamine N-acetyltransferase
MFLESENIILRAVEPSDATLIFQWENNIEWWKHGSILNPISQLEIEAYIENRKDIYLDKSLRLMIVEKENKETIGTIDIFDFDAHHKRAGVGILIAEKDFRNKGLAKESLKILIKYCSDILFINQLYCHISLSNSNSLELFKNAGFSISGTLKQWNRISKNEFEDVYVLQLFL